MLKDFKKFILRGNVVDLAVAVVVGAAFTGIVNSFVKDMITPLIAAIYKEKTFASAHFTINGSNFLYGDFINALVSFLLIAGVVFFFVVQPINKLTSRITKPVEKKNRKCPECLSEIPKAATRCAFCTAKVKPVVEK